MQTTWKVILYKHFWNYNKLPNFAICCTNFNFNSVICWIFGYLDLELKSEGSLLGEKAIVIIGTNVNSNVVLFNTYDYCAYQYFEICNISLTIMVFIWKQVRIEGIALLLGIWVVTIFFVKSVWKVNFYFSCQVLGFQNVVKCGYYTHISSTGGLCRSAGNPGSHHATIFTGETRGCTNCWWWARPNFTGSERFRIQIWSGKDWKKETKKDFVWFCLMGGTQKHTLSLLLWVKPQIYQFYSFYFMIIKDKGPVI